MRDQWYYWSARWTYQCTLAVNGQRSQTVVKLGSTACTGLYIKYQGRCAHWIIVLMLFPEWWQAFADAIGQGSTIKYVRVPQKVSWNTAQTIFKQFLKEDYSFFYLLFFMRVWIVRVLKLHWDGEPLRHQQTAQKDCCTLFWSFLHRIRIVPLRFVVCGMNMVLPETAYQSLNLWKVKCCQAISLAKT